MDVHQDLDSGRLPGAVRSDKTVDAAVRDLQIETVEHRHAAKFLVEIENPDWRIHFLERAPFGVEISSGLSRRSQCAARALVTCARFMPSFLASTTSCSNS